MEARDLMVVPPVGKYANIDAKLAHLQMIGAEIGGLLMKGKVRRYSTFSQSEIDQFDQAVLRKSSRTLLSM